MAEARCRSQLEHHSPGIHHSCSFVHRGVVVVVVLAVAMEELHPLALGLSHIHHHTSRSLCRDFVRPKVALRSRNHAGHNRHDLDGLAAMEQELPLVDGPMVGSPLLNRRTRPDRSRQDQLRFGRQDHRWTDYQRVLA